MIFIKKHLLGIISSFVIRQNPTINQRYYPVFSFICLSSIENIFYNSMFANKNLFSSISFSGKKNEYSLFDSRYIQIKSDFVFDPLLPKFSFHFNDKNALSINVIDLNSNYSSICFSSRSILIVKNLSKDAVTGIFINGIANDKRSAFEMAKDVVLCSDVNLLVVYNPSKGNFALDIIKAFSESWNYPAWDFKTLRDIYLAVELCVFLNNSIPFPVIAHSNGTTMFKKSLPYMSVEHKKLIKYLGVGPASIIEKEDGLINPIQVSSLFDPVPLNSPKKFLKGLLTGALNIQKPSDFNSYIDHSFRSFTYRKRVLEFLAKCKKQRLK